MSILPKKKREKKLSLKKNYIIHIGQGIELAFVCYTPSENKCIQSCFYSSNKIYLMISLLFNNNMNNQVTCSAIINKLINKENNLLPGQFLESDKIIQIV